MDNASALSDSPQFQQAQLNVARELFAKGQSIPERLLPAPLLASWQRSRQCGLMPWQSPEYELLSSRHNVHDNLDDRRLYQSVHAEIEQLWSAFGGRTWTIFCVNPQGVIVHARHSPGCDDPVLQPITAGRRMLEQDIGTTAPSCVLREGIECIVDGNQHYLSAFAQTFCLSVPLWGTDGHVVGALDITGQGMREVSLLQEQFRMASLSAEARMFNTLGHCHLLRVHYDPRWLTTPLAGVLAIEEDGQLRAASRLARRLLGLPAAGALRDQSLERLFADALPAQQKRLLQPSQAPHRVARGDGSHIWVQYARAPVRGRSVQCRQKACGQVPRPAAANDSGDDGLKEQTLHVIRHALAQHEGNVAATARQLGISRTTLYAKLRQARAAGILAQ